MIKIEVIMRQKHKILIKMDTILRIVDLRLRNMILDLSQYRRIWEKLRLISDLQTNWRVKILRLVAPLISMVGSKWRIGN
jgi:hypothetical protein